MGLKRQNVTDKTLKHEFSLNFFSSKLGKNYEFEKKRLHVDKVKTLKSLRRKICFELRRLGWKYIYSLRETWI